MVVIYFGMVCSSNDCDIRRYGSVDLTFVYSYVGFEDLLIVISLGTVI